MNVQQKRFTFAIGRKPMLKLIDNINTSTTEVEFLSTLSEMKPFHFETNFKVKDLNKQYKFNDTSSTF